MAARPAGRSVYRRWVREPETAMRLLDGGAFTARDLEAMGRWAAAQAPWGLGVRVARDGGGRPLAAEVLGPDGCAPHVLLYPAAGGGVRVDGYAGDVATCPTLAAALEHAVARA